MKKYSLLIPLMVCLHIQANFTLMSVAVNVPQSDCHTSWVTENTAHNDVGQTVPAPQADEYQDLNILADSQGIAGHVQPVRITLSFAGDCTLGTDEDFQWNNFDQVYQKVNDPAYFFEGVKSILGTDDFTLVNLEGALTTATEKAEKEFNYKGDPSYAEILVKGSVEGVTLANNHTLDFLDVGFEDTVNALTQHGVSFTNFETCFVREIKGLKVGFLGYKGFGYEREVRSLLVKQMAEMRAAGVDFVVASYHWGDMRSYAPNEQQIRMAHYAIDQGVDLVIGHHPHVLQGLETYKGKHILYSLGNFCYGGSPVIRDADTIIFQQIITFDPSTGSIVDLEYQIIPVHVTATPDKNDYRPVLADGSEKIRIMSKFARLSGQLIPSPYLPDMKLPGKNRQTAGGILYTLQ